MKKVVLGLAAFAVGLAVIPLFAAFEAHVVNVTATIENALSVPVEPINYGTVFPQEQLDRTLQVALSGSFLTEDRVDDVEYFIRQKPKCGITTDDGKVLVGPTATGHVIPDDQGGYTVDCGRPPRELTTGETWGMLPLLCPYLSKHPITSENDPSENDGSLDAFHHAFDIVNNAVDWNDTLGRLAKSQRDVVDNWNIDLKVPCFGGQCAQDWESFVHGINPDANPAEYVQPNSNEHKVFGCDLWVEVSGVSEAD